MAYVDLNPIRAGLALTPEASEFTSIQERIKNYSYNNDEIEKEESQLIPLMTFTEEPGTIEQIGATKSVIPCSYEDYLQLVDWTGRVIRTDKKSAIPESIKPILNRLQIDDKNWIYGVTGFESYFYRVVGQVARLKQASTEMGKHWLKGMQVCHSFYISPEPT